MKIKGNDIKKFAKKCMVSFKKHLPTILVVTGSTGMVITVVTACKETLDVQDDISKTMEVVTEIKNAKKSYEEDGMQKAYSQDLTHAYCEVGKVIVKHYYKSFIIGIGSLICIGSSHYILTNQLASRIVAYSALMKDFQEHRKLVAEELGDDKEREIMAKVMTNPERKHQPFSRIFDENSGMFEKHNPQYNLEFLYGAEEHFTNKLRTDGYVFLNEVLSYIDIPEIDIDWREFAGWYKFSDEDVVDFGLWNISDPGVRAFINGIEEAVWLNFNVDPDISRYLWERGEDLHIIANSWRYMS